MNGAEHSFLAAIAAAGLTPPPSIVADGAIHRFSTNGKRGDDAGWYLMHADGIASGAFGCWRTGLQLTWSQRPSVGLSQHEKERHRQLISVMHAQRMLDRSRQQELAAAAAAHRWNAAKSCTRHAYTVAKGVGNHGIRIERNGCLIVPMRDAAGTLFSLQSIAPNGEKRFLAGGRVKGCFHQVGELAGTLIVCEGYATGATIHEATSHAVAIAFNSGNLVAVAMSMRARHPDARIIVAADDDWHVPGNPGCSSAKQAALAVGGFIAVPRFSGNRPDKATDFNDLHALHGVDAVRACFDEIEEATC